MVSVGQKDVSFNLLVTYTLEAFVWHLGVENVKKLKLLNQGK